MMIDDDVKDIGYFEKMKKNNYSENGVYRFLSEGFRLCKELGTVLWGLNVNDDYKCYREYQPFSFSSIIYGPMFGLVRNDLRFDERLGLKEDCDYSIQVLNKYRKILRFNKYYYEAGHLIDRGGCSKYRTKKKEADQRDLLIKKWGSKIVKFRGNDTNPIIKVPLGPI